MITMTDQMTIRCLGSDPCSPADGIGVRAAGPTVISLA